jgi:hypothetical protein
MDEIKAVEMVRSIRDQIFKETRHMTPEELKAYIAREAAKSGTTAGPKPARPAA